MGIIMDTGNEVVKDLGLSCPGSAPARSGRFAGLFKTEKGKRKLLRLVPLFKGLTEQEIDYFAGKMKRRSYQKDDFIIYQGETKAMEMYLVETGECRVFVDEKEVARYVRGGCFGEKALLHGEARAATVQAATNVSLLVLGRQHFVEAVMEREQREGILRSCKLLEMLGSEAIAKLAAVLEAESFEKGTRFVNQGDYGDSFYILKAGHCEASVSSGEDEHGNPVEQVVKRYNPGDLFGELALLHDAPRAASITATSDCDVLMMTRSSFEALLGPLSQLHEEQYLADPRKLIADFYADGDQYGPAGFKKPEDAEEKKEAKTQWFAVFRPTSSESIAKMLDRAGAGKGLNIKGKSAKRGRLSGFVPFVQISDNADKVKVEAAPSDSRITVFYQAPEDREAARVKLALVMQEIQDRKLAKMDNPILTMIDDYPHAYGLDMPEAVLAEVYIMRPNLKPQIGWETGRASEPAFLNMNLHSLRDVNGKPKCVLYQFDQSDPLNPAGLLMAYAEATAESTRVKPVVSDFDTFTVGSRNMTYASMPEEQVALMKWSMQQTKGILQKPSDKPWAGQWLEVLRNKSADVKVELPEYGFGDPTSYGLIAQAVTVTGACGAVRHGAECFNFYFPQELDAEFLVVWHGFVDNASSGSPPWKYLSEPALREFLLERVKEDYSFPINPVWPIRDPGWYDVLTALRASEAAKGPLLSWYPEPELFETIEAIHKEHPNAFAKDDKQHKSWDGMQANEDLDEQDILNLAQAEINKSRERWQTAKKRISIALRMGSGGLLGALKGKGK